MFRRWSAVLVAGLVACGRSGEPAGTDIPDEHPAQNGTPADADREESEPLPTGEPAEEAPAEEHVTPTGALDWKAATEEVGASELSRGVAFSPLGNVFVSTLFMKGTQRAPGPYALPVAEAGAALRKYNPSGGLVWIKTFPGASAPEGTRVYPSGCDVDGSGNPAVLGTFSGTNDFGSGPTSAIENGGAFIVALGGDGAIRWSRTVTSEGAGVEARWVRGAFDPAGNFVAVGSFRGSGFDFGDGVPLDTDGKRSLVIAKYSGAGALLWVRAFSPDDETGGGPHALAVDVNPEGEIGVAFSLQEAMQFGGIRFEQTGTYRTVIARLDSAANPIWAKGVRMVLRDLSFSADSLAVVGFAWLSTSDGDGLLSVFDKHGQERWRRVLDQAAMAVLQSVEVGAQGDVWVTGDALQTGSVFAGKSLETAHHFVARLSAMGELKWLEALEPRARSVQVAVSAAGSAALAYHRMRLPHCAETDVACLVQDNDGDSDLVVERRSP